jgi:hypothetical protein
LFFFKAMIFVASGTSSQAAAFASVGMDQTGFFPLGVDCRAEGSWDVADAYAAVTESVGCPDAHAVSQPIQVSRPVVRHALR